METGCGKNKKVFCSPLFHCQPNIETEYVQS
jgi:hypothetical protein